MSVKEILSTMDPATSTFLDQIGGRTRDMGERTLAEDAELRRNAKSMACLTCRGRKRRKVRAPTETEPQRRRWVDCEACRGTGTRVDGAHSQTPSRGAPSAISAERLAEAVASMERHLLLAALLETTGNRDVVGELTGYVLELIVEPASRHWLASPDARAIRALGVARVATAGLLLGPMEYPTTRDATVLMCCSDQDWRRTWRDRAVPAVDRARGWSAAAGAYMNERLDRAREADSA